MQVLPTESASEAIEALNVLLSSAAAGNPGDDYFARDWSALWGSLAEGGWTALGDGSRSPDSDFSLLDITTVAELWGRFMVPLAFIPTLVVRRWAGELPAADVPLTYSVREGEKTLTPYGSIARRLSAPHANDKQTDSFAASLPITVSTREAPAHPAGMLREARLLLCAEAVGAAQKSLDATVEYVKIREQFGRPVGSFQGLKHLLANLHMEVELARSGIVWACNEPAATGDATRYVLGNCLRVAEGCIQAHGGIGFTWEAAPHRYLRHVMAIRRLVAARGEIGS